MNISLIVTFIWVLVISSHACYAQGTGTGGGGFAGIVRMQFGARVGSLDGFDSTDLLATPGYGWFAGTYHVNGEDGWLGPTGFYAFDSRAPLALGESKTWTFYVWAEPGTTEAARGFSGNLWTSDPNYIHTVMEYFQKPPGVTGGPELGTTWTAPAVLTLILPFYSTSDGRTGYGFRLTLTAVPEPSSLLALSGGILGFGALRLRKRPSQD